MLQSKWYGETQKLVQATFTLAYKLQPCIIFVGALLLSLVVLPGDHLLELLLAGSLFSAAKRQHPVHAIMLIVLLALLGIIRDSLL